MLDQAPEEEPVSNGTVVPTKPDPPGIDNSDREYVKNVVALHI